MSPASAPSAQDGPLLDALRRLGHAAFLEGQRDIIEAVLSGQPSVAIRPTGGGKSLCFQLPALLLPGVTVVVSPLIALMRDQVAALQARGVAATFINSTLSVSEREERQQNLHRYRLVYVAPERFKSPRFCEALARVPLQLFAVDEAHCISEWGHDFRPDYSRLGDVVRSLRPPRLLALTATATPEVREDIKTQLQMHEPRVFVHGFDRPNLDLLIERAGGDRDKLVRALRLIYAERSGVVIVYTSTRKKAVAVAEGLVSGGLPLVAPYHAGLLDAERHATESAFLGGKLRVIVATNAFGMGIDKRDVRLVIHHDLPRSPEAYYQEAGRAGRDGERARCVLLFNAGDARVQEFLIDQSAPDPATLRQIYQRVEDRGPIGEDAMRQSMPGTSGMMVDAGLRLLERSGCIADEDGGGFQAVAPLKWDQRALEKRQERERQKLRRMLNYGYHTGCRMRFFLDYFGDHLRAGEEGRPRGADRCGRCDNCVQVQAAPLSDEGQLLVRKALSAVARLDGRFGRRRVAEVLHGSRTQEIERARLHELPTFGLLAEHPAEWLMELLGRLEAAGLIRASTGEYPTLSLLSAGREVMHDRARAQLTLPTTEEGRGRKRAAKPAPRIHAPVTTTGAVRLARSAAGSAGIAGAATHLPPPTPPGSGRGGRADATDDDLPLTGEQQERYERLRQVRAELARGAGLPPFLVFHDRTLRAIARECPADQRALSQVSGVGPAKLEKYGQQVLAALES